ncbi:hypothetical protein WJX84_006628, partial [Apatococcus fuscideae]
VLSDPEKRKIYDQFGEDGLKGGMPSGAANGGGMPGGFPAGGFQFRPGNAEDIFSQFFGGASPFGGGGGGFGGMMDEDEGGFGSFMGMPGGASRMFTGGMPGMGGGAMRGGPFGGGPPAPTEHPLSFSLEELYKGCTKRLKVSRTITEPSGNSMRVQEPLEVNAKPGHKKGTKFTFAEKGDEGPGRRAADVVIVIDERPHPVFTREGNDLHYTYRLPLADALCGPTMRVPTLDGRQLDVVMEGVAHPHAVKVVRGEGMPISKSPGTKGDLRIHFDIAFPKSLSPQQKAAIRANLPAR